MVVVGRRKTRGRSRTRSWGSWGTTTWWPVWCVRRTWVGGLVNGVGRGIFWSPHTKGKAIASVKTCERWPETRADRSSPAAELMWARRHTGRNNAAGSQAQEMHDGAGGGLNPSLVFVWTALTVGWEVTRNTDQLHTQYHTKRRTSSTVTSCVGWTGGGKNVAWPKVNFLLGEREFRATEFGKFQTVGPPLARPTSFLRL